MLRPAARRRFALVAVLAAPLALIAPTEASANHEPRPPATVPAGFPAGLRGVEVNWTKTFLDHNGNLVTDQSTRLYYDRRTCHAGTHTVNFITEVTDFSCSVRPLPPRRVTGPRAGGTIPSR